MTEDIVSTNIREKACSPKARERKKSRVAAWAAGIAYFVLVTGVIFYKADDWLLTEEEFALLEAVALGVFLMEKLIRFLYRKRKERTSGMGFSNKRAAAERAAAREMNGRSRYFGENAMILTEAESFREKVAMSGKHGSCRKSAARAARRHQLRLRLAIVCIAAALIAAIGVRYAQVRSGIRFPASYVPGSLRVRYVQEQSDIPDSLLEFAEKYPEAEEFVKDYPEKKDQNVKIDLTDEVTAGEIPLFIQWDERWGYKIYGSDCMGVTGCGPTCVSMLVCGLTGNLEWNPYKTAQFAEEQGYYVSGTGTSWNMMTEGAQALGLTASSGTVSTDYIQKNLTAETPMVASMGPGDFTYTGHFIVLTGIDASGNVTVNDPNSPTNSAKTWSVDTLVSQMKAVWKYSAA